MSLLVGIILSNVIVNMTVQGYEPRDVEINVGDTVVFENKDKVSLWPASNIHPTHGIYPEFDPQKSIKPGESFKFKFQKGGNWKYHDHLYPEVAGVIKVKGETIEKENFLTNILKSIQEFFKQIFSKT